MSNDTPNPEHTTLNGRVIDLPTPERVTLTETEEAWGGAHWQLFREHRPTGAYPLVGQMAGDCRACGGGWPCGPVREALAERDAAREQVRREEIEADVLRRMAEQAYEIKRIGNTSYDQLDRAELAAWSASPLARLHASIQDAVAAWLRAEADRIEEGAR